MNGESESYFYKSSAKTLVFWFCRQGSVTNKSPWIASVIG